MLGMRSEIANNSRNHNDNNRNKGDKFFVSIPKIATQCCDDKLLLIAMLGCMHAIIV
jgi:hypothetical protein